MHLDDALRRKIRGVKFRVLYVMTKVRRSEGGAINIVSRRLRV